MRLSASELRQLLKERLLDDQIAEITDERLLVGGILDPLLAVSPDYATHYRIKAQEMVLDVYQASSIRKGHTPLGFWEGEQGLLNAGIVLRPMIAQQGWQVDRKIFEKFTTTWMQQQRMHNQVTQHGLYKLLTTAYPEYIFDPKRPTIFHLHWWDVQRCFWNESLIREAVRHTVHFHMPWGLSLCELANRFTVSLLRQENLYGIINNRSRRLRFNGNAYNLWAFVFPEYIFDLANPDNPHVHVWDVSHAVHWSKNNVREAIKHMVDYHTDWKKDELARKVTARWLREVNLEGMVAQRFRGSPLRLLQFVYPELFRQGILSEEDFCNLQYGIGVARFRHLLRSIPHNRRHVVRVGNVRYNFPHFGGYLIHRMSREYGGLYTPDKQLVGLFKWSRDSSVKYVTIQQEDIESVPPELVQPGRYLAFADAMRVLADEAQIVTYELSLKDQIALTEVMNIVEPAQVVDYLKTTGPAGLRAMADTEFYAALILVYGLFDQTESRQQFCQVIVQYNEINAKLGDISSLFVCNVKTIAQERLDAFRAELQAQMFTANERIINALSRALVYRGSIYAEVDRPTLIGNVLQAQRDFAMIIKTLGAFGRGALRLVRRRTYSDGTRDIHYTSGDADIYLVLRPRQNPLGQARIGFRIVPHRPEDAALSHELALRWDREMPTQTALDIHSDAFTRLSDLDRRQFPHGYHYSLTDSQFADAMFFEQIVQGFLPVQ